MNIRPYTYVCQAIDPNWIPFWPAPPFPGFPSGHSTQSAASAMALESVFGTKFEFTDTSWEGRPKDAKRNVEFKPRKFTSFWAAAEESALSRFYGGIHTNMDNLVGLPEGKKMGTNILQLKFKK
jgi:membrane-associated phospholipid phosphatase